MKEITCPNCSGAKVIETKDSDDKTILKFNCPICNATGKIRIPDKE